VCHASQYFIVFRSILWLRDVFDPALTCSLFRKNPTVRDPAPTSDKMPTLLLLDKTRAKLLAILTLQKADEISPDECGIEEWTDRRIDTGIT